MKLWPRWLRRNKRKLRRGPRLRFTREGRLYVAISIGIGLAAVNTGNNLLYLLLGWLLSLIVASGALSNLCLRGLAVTRRVPPRIHAHRPFVMEVTVENQKPRAASYSLELEDLADGYPVDKRCFFLKVPRSTSRTSRYRHTFHTRGLVTLDGFRVTTRFPFALFAKSRNVEASEQVLVYPAIRPVPLPPLRGRAVGDAPQHKLGRRGEFFGLRDYREGDDSRVIHWRSSARAGRLLIRELEEEAQRRVRIELDNGLAEPHTPRALDALEDAVSQAASLAVAYLKAGYAVGLTGRGLDVPPALGPGQERRLLRELALVTPATLDVPITVPRDAAAETVRVSA